MSIFAFSSVFCMTVKFKTKRLFMKKYFALILLMLISSEAYSNDLTNFGWKRLLPEITYEMAVDPVDPANVYVGGISNIFYISRDSGKTFIEHSIVSPVGTAIMNNIIISRKDHNVILAGGIRMGNLYRSADAGLTWKDVTSDITSNCFLNGKALVEDMFELGHFYLANYNDSRLYESFDNGLTWDTLSIVYGPLLDSNNNFNMSKMVKQKPTCLGVRPDSSNILLCGNQGGTVMLSTDKGKNWTHFSFLRDKNFKPTAPGIDVYDNEITMFAFDGKDPKIVYASITYTFTGNNPNGGIWKSTDGGYNWEMFAFPDSSFWGVATKNLENGYPEIFVGGYTANPSLLDSVVIPGDKIVRGSIDNGKTWWVYDNKIDWFDPYPVFTHVKYMDERLIAVGTKSNMTVSYNKGTDWIPTTFYDGNREFTDAIFLNKDSMLISTKGGNFFANLKNKLMFDTIKTGYNDDIYRIARQNDYSYFAVGANGLFISSYPNIWEWKKETINTKNNLRDIQYLNNKVYICGDEGIIFIKNLSTDTWTENKIGKENFYALSIGSNNFGMVSGANGAIYKTSDGGITWNKITNLNYDDTLFSVKCYGNNQAIAVGKKSTAFYTKDGGDTWTKISFPIKQDLFSVDFINKDTAIVCGSSKTLMLVILESNHSNLISSSFGPTGNVWSLRYLGAKNKEKLYMATEAGFFVFDHLSSAIQDITKDDPQGNLNFKLVDNELYIAYKRVYENSRNPLRMRIIDINGREILAKSYDESMFENIIDAFDISRLATGMYIIEYIEKDRSTVKKFIKK